MNLFDAEMKYLYDNGFTVLTMADLAYDESTHQLYIEYIGPSTIKQIGGPTTTQIEAVPEDEDDDAQEEEDMGLESDNNADIGFDNSEMEEEEEKQKFGAAIYAADYKELQRIMDQEVVEFSNLLANLYQVTNMSRRLYFCLCYTKPRYSLSNT